jgi:phospholipase/carboxylesterase
VHSLAVLLASSLALAACSRNEPPRPSADPPAASIDPSEATGVRFVELLTGGANAGEPLPLVIAIHGRGGSPQNMAHLFDAYKDRARVILPYGFEPLGDGFNWLTRWFDEPAFADDTRQAADRLAAMIAELVHRHPIVGKPIVTGFSQGGILSFTLAVLHPEIVRAAFPVGGFLAPPLYPDAWPKGVEMPRVHAFHGSTTRGYPSPGIATRYAISPGLGSRRS